MNLQAKRPVQPEIELISSGLAPQDADPLLSLIALHKGDPREHKIDLGVGVYRNSDGTTPVFAAVKAAEDILLRTQSSKAYLGPEGNPSFLEALSPIALGKAGSGRQSIGIQTPGGTGALRLGADLLRSARPQARIWLGSPSWVNHRPIFQAAGMTVATYRAFDPRTQDLRFDDWLETLEGAEQGDVVLLHGCCHNPTGGDPDRAQWAGLAKLISARGLIPFVDLAYQGLGRGLGPDREGLELMAEASDEVLLAYSCDKNFGLYRERTGALFALCRSETASDLIRSNALASARANWSMPPDHGAAVVDEILRSADLTRMWENELEQMRNRLTEVRKAIANADPHLAPIGRQFGLFSLLALEREEIDVLRRDFGIYMAGSGRINIAGLTDRTIPRFLEALAHLRNAPTGAISRPET